MHISGTSATGFATSTFEDKLITLHVLVISSLAYVRVNRVVEIFEEVVDCQLVPSVNKTL